MPFSLSQACLPALELSLNALSGCLDKGRAFAKTKNFDAAVLLNTRLAPDMFPLVRQVQIATDLARNGAARLAGVEPPRYEDTETSIDELKARIAKTVDFIGGVKAAQVDGSEDKPIALRLRGGEVNFTGLSYLLGYALPNFYFHAVTAYDMLRHNGVELGKRDFLGSA